MSNANSLEELVKKYLSTTPLPSKPDSYDIYKHKNAASNNSSYADAVASLYAATMKNLSSYGSNGNKISNKGLQNSGYAAYIDDMNERTFNSGVKALSTAYGESEAQNRASYASYLEKYKDTEQRTKRSVMSHLIDNDVVDINTAIAYGMNAGLSPEDAKAVGESAYEVTKQKAINKILEQTVSLGLDKDGAKALALKMGISEQDASAIAEEVGEMMEYYANISKEYLEFLEQRSNNI